MKTAAAATAVILAATLAAAEPQHAMPSGTKINCSKPNATYCMGGDIILRCDANAVGTPGRCSDNVSGYPPAGGIAQCWQSSRDAGDAACQKNVRYFPNCVLCCARGGDTETHIDPIRSSY